MTVLNIYLDGPTRDGAAPLARLIGREIATFDQDEVRLIYRATEDSLSLSPSQHAALLERMLTLRRQ